MKLTKKTKLFINMIMLAQAQLEKLTEEDIQDYYGSDAYHELKQYLKDVYGLYERRELND